MITLATVDKCIGQAEAIIRYYCDIKKIPSEDKDDFRSEGLLGMCKALQRLRDGIVKGKGAATTYCNSYVKGYLKHYHTKLYERRKSQSWYNVNQAVDIEPHTENPFLSMPSVEDEVVAKDFIGRLMHTLTEKQYHAVYNQYFMGYTPTESASRMGWSRRSDPGSHMSWAFKKMRKLDLDEPSN